MMRCLKSARSRTFLLYTTSWYIIVHILLNLHFINSVPKSFEMFQPLAL